MRRHIRPGHHHPPHNPPAFSFVLQAQQFHHDQLPLLVVCSPKTQWILHELAILKAFLAILDPAELLQIVLHTKITNADIQSVADSMPNHPVRLCLPRDETTESRIAKDTRVQLPRTSSHTILSRVRNRQTSRIRRILRQFGEVDSGGRSEPDRRVEREISSIRRKSTATMRILAVKTNPEHGMQVHVSRKFVMLAADEVVFGDVIEE